MIKRLELKQEKKYNGRRQAIIEAVKERHLDVSANLATISSQPLAVKPRTGNALEDQFAELITALGYTSVKSGWPDFLCWRGKELIFVEVKPDNVQLEAHQRLVMTKLIRAGLKCYKWSPGEGLRFLNDHWAKNAI